MNVTAFMTCYNEADILAWTIGHLIEQGVDVHVIDNWSTDGSDEIAQEFPLVGFERWPVNGPSALYLWRGLLQRVEVLASESRAAWCVHHDADEVRRSPRVDESLRAALERVEREGYNAVDHQVWHFHPTDNLYCGDPERHFLSYTTSDHVDAKLRHIKAWQNVGRVDLASSGGHVAQFQGMRIYPEKFILKHYPIRSQEHGARKVLQERIPRYDPAERAMQWHVQYEKFRAFR